MSRFSQAVAAWSKKTGEDVGDIVIASVTDLSRRIIQRTPVGNPDLWASPPPPGYTGGQAKGNWFASIGAPSHQVDFSIKAKNAARPMKRDEHIRQNAAGNIYYLTNNLPYIRRIEYEGWSSQAPQGMVRVSVAEFNRSIEKAIRDVT